MSYREPFRLMVSLIYVEGGEKKMNVSSNILNLCNIKWNKTNTEAISSEIFVKLIQDNKVSLYRLCKSIIKDEYEAEDIISEAILKAFKNLHRLKCIGSFKPWIMKIVVNECYNSLRKSKGIELKESMETLNLTYEEEPNHELMDTINRLNKEFRSILTLFYYEDMSIKDISEVLNISQGTVKSRLSRAKASLKLLLEDD